MSGFHLQNARVLSSQGWRDGGLAFGSLIGDGERILEASGLWALPGIIDLHGDGFERHVAPRRGMLRDLGAALGVVEVELASCGITTAYLAQFVSWEGGMRGPEFAERFAAALAGYTGALDLRMQLRLETHAFRYFQKAEEMIVDFGIDYVVLNDHLPHKELRQGKRPPRLEGQALKAGRSPDAHRALLEQLHGNGPEVLDRLGDLVARLPEGVMVGSHDDPDAERRAEMVSIGAQLSEFPETLEALRAAQADGGAVVLGAPNLVRGKSHKGNLAVRDVIEAGHEVALVSDYHYPSLFGAVWTLVDGGMAFERAWRFVSELPAAAMGWTDRGRLDVGLRGDVVLVDPVRRRIEATFSGGALAYASPAMLARWLG